MRDILRKSAAPLLITWLLLAVSVLLPPCSGAAEVTVKSSGLDFIQNLIADIDAITPVKKYDGHDFAQELSSRFKLNTIYNVKQINSGIARTELESKCTELMQLKGADFSSQLSMIIHDAIKIAFSKEYDPLGLGIKQGVMKAEAEIPRSSFQITYSFKYDISIENLVDILYTARAEPSIQEKYAILVEFIADLVNVAKMRRNIAIDNDMVTLSKLAFGSNIKPPAQAARANEPREKKPPVNTADTAQGNILQVPPKQTIPLSAPTAVESAAAKTPKATEKIAPDQKAIPVKAPEAPSKKALPAKTASAQSPPVALKKPAGDTTDNNRHIAKTDSDPSNSIAPSPERRLSFAIKPKSAYTGIDECVQANIGAAVSLSAGYGTMDVLKITRYLCEGIFLAKNESSAEYSGYENCVEKNIGNGSDGFALLKHALGFCDKVFDIRER